MAFNKNWKQFVVSKGEPFKIEYLDRKFGGRATTVFEVTEDGDVEVNGHVMDGTQNIVGDLDVSGDFALGGDATVDGDVDADNLTAAATVTGADLVATDDLTVGDDAAVGGDLAVTGAIAGATFSTSGLAKLNTGSFKVAVVAGADASVTPVQTTLTGAAIGDKVLTVIDLTNGADVTADFEATITVTNKIVQATTDLSGATSVMVWILKRS